MAQDGPKIAQRNPTWPKMVPRWPQDGPKMAPGAQDGPSIAQDGPKIVQYNPRWLKMAHAGPSKTTASGSMALLCHILLTVLAIIIFAFRSIAWQVRTIAFKIWQKSRDYGKRPSSRGVSIEREAQWGRVQGVGWRRGYITPVGGRGGLGKASLAREEFALSAKRHGGGCREGAGRGVIRSFSESYRGGADSGPFG